MSEEADVVSAELGDALVLNERSSGPVDGVAYTTQYGDSFFVAWAGDGNLNPNIASVWPNPMREYSGWTFHSEQSAHGMRVTTYQSNLFIAWTGTDGRLNMWNSSDVRYWNPANKRTFDGPSIDRPAIAGLNEHDLFLAWTSADGSLRLLNTNSGNPQTLPGASAAAPALVGFDGKLVLAWTDFDDKRIKVASSGDGGATWQDAVTLDYTAMDGPALGVTGDGKLRLAWTGTDGDHHLNVATSVDGCSFTDQSTLSDTARYAPGIAGAWGQSVLVWTGTDPSYSLNARIV